MNIIQGKKPSGRKWNRLFDSVVTSLKYNKSTIYHNIYIKALSGIIVLYPAVSIYDVLNTTNNEIKFTEPTRVFEEHFEIKVREGYVLHYLNFRIFYSPLGFSVYQTYHIMELVNSWFPTGKFMKVDKPFRKYCTCENELMDVLTLAGDALHKTEIEYHEKLDIHLEVYNTFLVSV